MASYFSGIQAKDIGIGAVQFGVVVLPAAIGLVQIGTVFLRALSYVASKVTPQSIQDHKGLLAGRAWISEKLGTLFISTEAYNETHKTDVAALDANGKEVKKKDGKTEVTAKKGDQINSSTGLIVSGIALCLVGVAALKLMSYMSAGDSPLNKVITYFTPFQVASTTSYTAFNSLGDLKSSII